MKILRFNSNYRFDITQKKFKKPRRLNVPQLNHRDAILLDCWVVCGHFFFYREIIPNGITTQNLTTAKVIVNLRLPDVAVVVELGECSVSGNRK